MKRYSILIHGTGTCGEGNEASADIALQKLLEQLRTAGHNFTSVSMVIDGATVPIIGPMQAHPAADSPASADAVSLTTISKQLEQLTNGQNSLSLAVAALLDMLKKEGPPPAPKAPMRSRAKKEDGADEGAKMVNANGKPAPATPSPVPPTPPASEEEPDDGAAGEPQPPEASAPVVEAQTEEPTEQPAA